MPKEETQFKPGNGGGPGRPKGSVSGRTKSLQTLDAMLAKTDNQEKLMRHLQDMFDKNPSGFLLKFIYPLAPKNVTFDAGDNELTVTIKPPKKTDDKV